MKYEMKELGQALGTKEGVLFAKGRKEIKFCGMVDIGPLMLHLSLRPRGAAARGVKGCKL